MSALLSPDAAQIERELDKILEREAGDRVLGMRAPTPRLWPDSVECRGIRFRLAWCASALQVREQLDAVPPGDGVVVLTPLDPSELGCDVVARLARGRLVQSDRWTALRNAFRAREIDPRLRSQGWLADLLLQHAPRAGYAPVTADTLDLETAWQALLSGVLGLSGGPGDAVDLLLWTLDPIGPDRFQAMQDETRIAIASRLAALSGGSAALVMAGVTAGRAAEMVPFALACSVVFAEDAPPASLRDAAIRLERVVGGAPIDAAAGRDLAKAGGRILARIVTTDPALARTVQDKAALMLSDIRAADWLAHSPVLDAGLDARMVDAAKALSDAAVSMKVDDAAWAWSKVQHADRHERASERRDRLDRLWMAARLARWLADGPSTTSRKMADAAGQYALDGGYADYARRQIRFSDELPEIRAAYDALRMRALTRREAENQVFAAVLRDWLASGSAGTDPLPIERMLDTVVAPLARESPVLLLVLDGLSFAVWRPLSESIGRLGWTELQLKDRHAARAAVAVLPSETAASRASMLAGTLGRGDQGYERVHFEAHPALGRASRGGKHPKLFHKASLGAGPELDQSLRDALADPERRVVSVVHNAIDAQLSGSDQLEVSWSAEVMAHLTPMLRLARDVGRILIVTGDHGHVLDEGTTRAAPGAGGRWREGGTIGEGELDVSGSRVLSPTGGRRIVAAWSERIRNGASRNGYHGGISPQEVLVPLAVLSAGAPAPGWEESSTTYPGWWIGESRQVDFVSVVTSASARRREPAEQPGLFANLDPRSPARPAAEVAPAWIATLLASPAYKAQRRLASRGAPADEQIQALVTALAVRGGKLSQSGLATAMAVPQLRVPGLVNAASRVLNLDQSQVLRIDDSDVVLDIALLSSQFELIL